jgi:uncharacterized protein
MESSMSTTERLLRVFRVDQQLGGLQSRLKAAERFYEEQTRQVAQLDLKRDAINVQLRQLQAATANHEGEMARLDARIEKLREQMNTTKTNKEYKALLTEVNTIKADRGKIETAALEGMTKVDELRKQLAELDTQRAERERMQKVAADDKARKADEIKDRLSELKAQREHLAGEIPSDILSIYMALVRTRGDEAMAPVNELDRRRHEYTCGACQMAVPMETVSTLISGKNVGAPITRCVSCGSILYLEQETHDKMPGGPNSGGGGRGKKRKAGVEEL